MVRSGRRRGVNAWPDPGIPTTPGTYEVTISATNEGGTGTATLVIVIAPLDPPVINSPLSISGVVGLPFEYTITATHDPTGFDATGLPPGLFLDGPVIGGVPTISGSFEVTISASNDDGSDTQTLIITIIALGMGTIMA